MHWHLVDVILSAVVGFFLGFLYGHYKGAMFVLRRFGYCTDKHKPEEKYEPSRD